MFALSSLCLEESLHIPRQCGHDRGAHIFQKSTSHLKILSTRRVAWSKFCSEDRCILGTSVQNLVATATCNQDLCTSYHDLPAGVFFLRRLRMFHSMDCLFVCGSKWWPQVSSAATMQDKKACPSASKYANNFNESVFLLFFIYLFLFIYFILFFLPNLRLWGTHLAHNFEHPRSQMMWLTHCWMFERLCTVCWLWCIDSCK